MTKQQTPSKKQDAIAPLVRQVSLVDLRLLGSQTRLELDEPPPADLHQRINSRGIRARHNDIDHVICILAFAVSDQEIQPPPEPVRGKFVLEASFALAYAFNSLEGITDEQITEFSQRNALYNAWPYWREFVQSMTTRMGLPALKIPLLRPADLTFTNPAEVGEVKKKKALRKKTRKAKN